LLPDRPASGGPVLALAIAGGPLRAALRPAELEAEDLRGFLLATSLTGPNAVLTPAQGTDVAVRQDVIQLTQADGASAVILNEAGHLLVTQSIRGDDDWRVGIPAVIEEDAAERLTRAIRFAVEMLDHVDSLQRLSHVAVVAALDGAGYAPWRTREEHASSPNAATMSMGREERAVVGLVPPVRRRAHPRNSYLAVHRSGAVELELGDLGAWEREDRHGSTVRQFNLISIVAYVWGMASVAERLVERTGVGGPFYLTVALVNTGGAVLGDVAEGWAEPHSFENHVGGCADEHLLWHWELAELPAGDDLRELALSVGDRLEDAWGVRQRRYLANRGELQGSFDHRRVAE
jgi:hypothetical protein